jgi:hypothetical protein
MENEGTVFGEIVKNDTDKIVVSLKEYKGRQYVDIRTWFYGEKGDCLPTKKGVTLSQKQVSELIAVLSKIPAAVEAKK